MIHSLSQPAHRNQQALDYPTTERITTNMETEYLQEKRNLEDLWKAAFPVGTEWERLDAIYKFNWDFKHLEEALENEEGILYGKKIFVFGFTETQPESYSVIVPTVIVIESPFPPSDKVGITSVQSVGEPIIPMKQMKMDWVPYIPYENRNKQVDRLKNFQIYTMVCTQRRVALRSMKQDRAMQFNYCIPYFYQPFTEDELEQSTEVEIMFTPERLTSEGPVLCNFDWKFNKLEEFVDERIEEEILLAEDKDEFKEFVKKEVRAAKKANREAKEAGEKTTEEMSEDTKQAFQNIKFYKFYPKTSPDVPRFIKSPFINRYYRNAHQVI